MIGLQEAQLEASVPFIGWIIEEGLVAAALNVGAFQERRREDPLAILVQVLVEADDVGARP
jgi:hypothetical protein